MEGKYLMLVALLVVALLNCEVAAVGSPFRRGSCIPFQSRYSDCTEENKCTGCTECTCSDDGEWMCKKVNKCTNRDDQMEFIEMEEPSDASSDADEMKPIKPITGPAHGPPRLEEAESELISAQNKPPCNSTAAPAATTAAAAGNGTAPATNGTEATCRADGFSLEDERIMSKDRLANEALDLMQMLSTNGTNAISNAANASGNFLKLPSFKEATITLSQEQLAAAFEFILINTTFSIPLPPKKGLRSGGLTGMLERHLVHKITKDLELKQKLNIPLTPTEMSLRKFFSKNKPLRSMFGSKNLTSIRIKLELTSQLSLTILDLPKIWPVKLLKEIKVKIEG